MLSTLADYIPELITVFAVFFVADMVYVLDHYFVHYDRDRYRKTHARHHRRYNGPKSGPQLDAFELSTYNSAAFGLLVAMSVLTLFTGNVGFVAGAALKWVHSLVFHCYQHGWWTGVSIRNVRPDRPPASWGLATASYHAWHHSNPNDTRFTFAESWAGFDRILEKLHPWLIRFTVDARAGRLYHLPARGERPSA
ncbi:MAG: sterol desaturase family protein [Planctomycetota bacterium]|nr:sterol desaturase family protein [Planctomycetota bacterium]